MKQTFGQVFDALGRLAIGCCLFGTAIWLAKSAYKRFKEVRLDAEKRRLVWEDQQNRIEGAP
jgi:hypothetical protein